MVRLKNSQKFISLALSLVFFTTSAFVNAASAQVASSTADSNADLPVDSGSRSASSTFAVEPGIRSAHQFDGLKVTFPEKSFSQKSSAVMTHLKEQIETPWQLTLLSDVYQVDIKDASAYSKSDFMEVELAYQKMSDKLIQIFFYDGSKGTWRPLPSGVVRSRGVLVAKLPFPYARIAIFEQSELLAVGKASWYKYKGGLFAASPDFPAGSRLRVVNLDSKPQKFIDVVVNDFGPDRNKHPERVIDLDKEAFKRIAPLGQGTINVRVEPLIVAPASGNWQGQPANGYSAGMRLTTKAGVVIDSKTGEVLWSKNATNTMPIASLTKLVSAYVFLEAKPAFDRVVSYSVQDENYNYQFANKWEVARLKVSDGETMTVKDLFYSALVGSANNAVESLVRVSGMKRDDFIKRMNQLVLEWGASSTHFIEPTGLSPENVSSAQDYAIISNKALSHPIIEDASKVKSYTFATLDKKIPHTIKNSNQLVTASRLKVSGSKTGYLDEAGYCLLTRAEDVRGNSVIVVTLGSPSRSTSFSETESLAKYGLSLIK
jgi:D-alanyl-D-alanine carboxypeptidase